MLQPSTPQSVVRHSLWRSLAAAAVFALSIPIALVSVEAARYSRILVAVSHTVLARIYGRIGSRAARSEG